MNRPANRSGHRSTSGRLQLRASRKAELSAIELLHRQAFGREFEAALTRALLEAPTPTLSVVAVLGGAIVGHVLLSEIGAPVSAMALAPLAVAASHREMQVGSRLVEEAIGRAAQAGYAAIFVLGDNAFYERFGFAAPLAAAFEVEWRGPHFMALELRRDALKGKKGRLIYPAAFEPEQ